LRLSEIVESNVRLTEKKSARPQRNSSLAKFDNNLTTLAKALTKGGVVKHSRNLNWSRAFLSKSRYMAGAQCPKKLWLTVYMDGAQCPKKLWLTVYDPEPEEEPLPGTVKGMGIEVGIKARPRLCHGNSIEHALRAKARQASCRCDGILPLCGSFGPEDPQCGSGDEMTLKVEGVVNRTVLC
jgi:hypothetical protein